jgi:molecular chaperone IbpA
MRTDFDLSGFRRSTIGFDRLFDLLESSAAAQNGDGYPPFDLEHDGGDGYRITLAVAGFKPDEIDVTAKQNMLIVSARKSDEQQDDTVYLHRGIARRSFERRFELADFVQVKGADLKDGLLTIDLLREIPEAMRPRKIEIGGNVRQLETSADQPSNEAAKAA